MSDRQYNEQRIYGYRFYGNAEERTKCELAKLQDIDRDLDALGELYRDRAGTPAWDGVLEHLIRAKVAIMNMRVRIDLAPKPKKDGE